MLAEAENFICHLGSNVGAKHTLTKQIFYSNILLFEMPFEPITLLPEWLSNSTML